MRKKRQKTELESKIAMAAFLLACIIPAAAMFLLPAPTPAANQRLSPLPRVWLPDGSFNLNITREITDYIADHIGFRQEMITARAVLDAKLFHVSSEDSVILGRDDWLFYRETLDNVLRINSISERKLYGAAHTLALFYLTIAPNKASLYGEKLVLPGEPLYYGPDDVDRFSSWLKAENINYIDLRSAFQSAFRENHEFLYYHTDSHWNTQGAAFAHDKILEFIKGNQLQESDLFFSSAYHDGEKHAGDLYQMLYPAGKYQEPDIEFDKKFNFEYISDFHSPEDQLIETQSPGKAGNLLMFRDSFGNSLHKFMADSYGQARFSRAMPVRVSLLDDDNNSDINNNINNIDTVLLEVVERNLKYLSDRIPAFPAPRRTWDDLRNYALDNNILNTDAAPVNLTRMDDGAFQDLIRFNGNLNNINIDTDSPVYIEIGSVLDSIDNIYEASPVGAGENAFALYMPDLPENTELRVYYYSQGALRGVPAVIKDN